MADELTPDEVAAALAGMGRVMLRLARVMQAMAMSELSGLVHAELADLVADLERLTDKASE